MGVERLAEQSCVLPRAALANDRRRLASESGQCLLIEPIESSSQSSADRIGQEGPRRPTKVPKGDMHRALARARVPSE